MSPERVWRVNKSIFGFEKKSGNPQWKISGPTVLSETNDGFGEKGSNWMGLFNATKLNRMMVYTLIMSAPPSVQYGLQR